MKRLGGSDRRTRLVMDISGQKFGRLTVKELSPERGKYGPQWICQCDCGEVAVIQSRYLLRGDTRSCGCLRRELGEATKTHGHSGSYGNPTPTYYSWLAMKQRCCRPEHKHYSSYGGRGITICDRWMEFENFLEDMGERPEGKTVDRIDVNGNYEPSNCRWATAKEQAENRR